MATLAQMRTWVSKRLIDANFTSVSSADVDELINMAQTYWKKRRFYFNEGVEVVTLAQSDPSVPLPSDFLVPAMDNGAFVIEYSGIRYPLNKVSETLYNALYLSNGVGQPWQYAKMGSQGYRVYPIPDKAYELRISYLRDYSDLTQDTDSNAFSEEANLLLQYTAAAYGMRDFRQDQNMYTAFTNQATAEYQNLLLQTRKENATGTIETNSLFYN